jgi:hypothetical protein
MQAGRLESSDYNFQSNPMSFEEEGDDNSAFWDSPDAVKNALNDLRARNSE